MKQISEMSDDEAVEFIQRAIAERLGNLKWIQRIKVLQRAPMPKKHN